jgi:mannose-6-phosphate isomerase-like protein (cupin superfamily)
MTQTQPQDVAFSETILPTRHDAVAPDGSLVRLLQGLPGGSLAHFELGVGEVSRPKRHHTVSEIWYIIGGLGTMWRSQDGLPAREIDLRPGVALTIPVGTSFQFRNTGREPLAAIGVTMPPWPGEGEALEADGPWTPKLRSEASRNHSLVSGGAVDSFPERVGVPVVPGVLGDHVDQDPAQRDRLPGRALDAGLVE